MLSMLGLGRASWRNFASTSPSPKKRLLAMPPPCTSPHTHPMLHLPAMPAADKRAPAQWHIPGAMQAPSAFHVASNKRHKLTVGVVARIGCPTVVTVLSGSSFPSAPALQQYYTKKEHKPSKDLTGEEYANMVREAVPRLSSAGGRGGHDTRSAARFLLHDRDPAHKAVDVQAAAASAGVQVVQGATIHADLDPLDYGVFGIAKREWRKRKVLEEWSWDEQCLQFIRMVEGADVDACIRALPARMQACIEAKGQEFEQQYRKGHNARKKKRI